MGNFSIGDRIEDIALQLDGTREGDGFRCLCPICSGRGLSVTTSRRSGKLLFHCFTSDCSFLDIVEALREVGIETGTQSNSHHNYDGEIAALARRIRYAHSLYRRGEDALGTIVETYHHRRGIKLLSPVLRFIRFCPHRNGCSYPAMAAPVVDVDGAIIGMSATFLRADGSGKVDLPAREQRQFYGMVKGGAVRLETLGEPLLVGEGIESVLSAMQLRGCLSGWAALSAIGLRSLDLPPEIESIVIAADNDDVGIDATLFAYRRWSDEGRTVRIITPPDADKDFNDTLRTRGLAS
jgi:hypothetical protein